jgi:prepilin-type N-terminal cleavage/methylation domain-containing protein
MLNSKSKGFTLIELLVVIAIVGVLSVIIVSIMASSKNKSNDARVKSQMSSLKRTTQIFSEANGNSYGIYTEDCNHGIFIDTISETNKFTKASNYPYGTTLACRADSNAWAVSGSISSGKFWCVDSEGKAQEQISAITAPFCS